MLNNLGQRIHSARESAGFTQEALAEAIGVSRTAVARWENGDIEPKLQNLICLAQSLNVSTDWLLGIQNKADFEALSGEAICAMKKFISEIKNSV